ncbi:ATP-binding cassette domain-containing protein [Bifidobacterium leontopitheci]|nr:energy-coupling factor ABC transporter ATP-binding protein [Bifidobacterium leontopitheci]
MGLFDIFGRHDQPRPSTVTFTFEDAAYTYDDGGNASTNAAGAAAAGNVGLLATSLTITPEDRRVAVIGLNGAGKTTLLKLLDGALTATSGSVRITAGDDELDPGVKKDLRRIEDLVGRVRREEIPNSYYRAATIREAIDQPLKKHKVPESERMAIVGNLFAHFRLNAVARQPASALNSEQRHLLAIASALSFSPAAIVADEPTKGLDEIGSAHVAEALFGYDKQVVFATHDVDLIVRPQYAISRTLVVDGHRIVFDGAPKEAAAFYNDLVRRRYEESKLAH